VPGIWQGDEVFYMSSSSVIDPMPPGMKKVYLSFSTVPPRKRKGGAFAFPEVSAHSDRKQGNQPVLPFKPINHQET